MQGLAHCEPYQAIMESLPAENVTRDQKFTMVAYMLYRLLRENIDNCAFLTDLTTTLKELRLFTADPNILFHSGFYRQQDASEFLNHLLM